MSISITLRITGDFLVPEEITSILGVKPHIFRRKGDVRTSPSKKEIISKFGLWTWKSDDLTDQLTIDDHINHLKNTFQHTYRLLSDLPNAESVWLDICLVKAEIDVSSEQSSFLLNMQSITTLKDFGLPVEFTFYH